VPARVALCDCMAARARDAVRVEEGLLTHLASPEPNDVRLDPTGLLQIQSFVYLGLKPGRRKSVQVSAEAQG